METKEIQLQRGGGGNDVLEEGGDLSTGGAVGGVR